MMALSDEWVTPRFIETIGNIQFLKFTGVKWDGFFLWTIQDRPGDHKRGGGLRHFWNLREIVLVRHRSEDKLDAKTETDWKDALIAIFKSAQKIGELGPSFETCTSNKPQTLASTNLTFVGRQYCHC